MTTISTVEELAKLPSGTVVLSAAGTIACRYDDTHGVVFGDERPFDWTKIALPAQTLHPRVVTEAERLGLAQKLFQWDISDHPEPRPTWGQLTDAQQGVWFEAADVAMTEFGFEVQG